MPAVCICPGVYRRHFVASTTSRVASWSGWKSRLDLEPNFNLFFLPLLIGALLGSLCQFHLIKRVCPIKDNLSLSAP